MQSWETIGISAKSCSHLQECCITAQDHVVGSEEIRGVGTAATGATPSLLQSSPLGSVALGLSGLRAGAGSSDGYSGGGVAGTGEPPVPNPKPRAGWTGQKDQFTGNALWLSMAQALG